ncbi:MAG: 5-deoxy-glucuronate isomerase [Acidimicrobiales bacterium]
MTSTRPLHLPAGAAVESDDPVLVTPERAGWTFAGLRVIRLTAGVPRTLTTGEHELAVLPLTATDLVVQCDGERFEVDGRPSPFGRVTDFAYAPMEAEVTITSRSGGEVALPMAKARRRLAPAYGPAEKVAVEIRGAGPSTRQVNNFLTPDGFPADKLVSVELLTPDGNWSSYPPHKHDEVSDCEVVNEEIYYFRIAGDGGIGFHRLYSSDGELNETVTVRDGDVFLIPRGYHGPSVAAPGYPMYYLNVLAGPAEERSMAFCDDPAHAWVRDSWGAMATDPRCPMTSAGGMAE